MQMWAPCFEVWPNLYAGNQFLMVNSISRGGHCFWYMPFLQGRTILKKGPEVQGWAPGRGLIRRGRHYFAISRVRVPHRLRHVLPHPRVHQTKTIQIIKTFQINLAPAQISRCLKSYFFIMNYCYCFYEIGKNKNFLKFYKCSKLYWFLV